MKILKLFKRSYPSDTWIIIILVCTSLVNLQIHPAQDSIFLFYAWIVYVLSRVPTIEVQRSQIKALHFGLLLGFISFIIYLLVLPHLLIGFTSLLREDVLRPNEASMRSLQDYWPTWLLAWNIYSLVFLTVFNLYHSVVLEAQQTLGWFFLALSLFWIDFLIMCGLNLFRF